MWIAQQTNSHTSIEALVIEISKDDVVFATLLSIATMALMLLGDSTTSLVRLTVTSLSSPKKTGSEVGVKDCKI